MENKLTQLRNDVLKQLNSYVQFPAKSDFDKGYKAGMKHTLGIIISLDGKLRNKETIKWLEENDALDKLNEKEKKR